MVLAAFLISSAAILVVLALLQGAQAAAKEKNRVRLLAEVGEYLADATADDPEHAKGSFDGMPVEITLAHHDVIYQVQLPPAVIRYQELLERFGGPELKHQLTELNLSIDGKDRVVGSVPREDGFGESLATIGNRLPVVKAIRELRRHAPGELLTRLERAHSAYEIDQILLQLTQHYPDAAETQDAIELAAEREHGHPDRVRARAERWLGRATV